MIQDISEAELTHFLRNLERRTAFITSLTPIPNSEKWYVLIPDDELRIDWSDPKTSVIYEWLKTVAPFLT